MSLVQRVRSSRFRRSSRLSCEMATRNGRISMVEPRFRICVLLAYPMMPARPGAGQARIRSSCPVFMTARLLGQRAERGPVGGRDGAGVQTDVLAQGGGRGEPAAARQLLVRQPGGLEQ